MRKILLVALCAVCALTASAQRARSTSTSFFSTEKADDGVTFGVRAGLNFANCSGDVEDTDGRLGFNAGVIADIPLMRSLYVQTGLYLSTKGAKNEVSYDGEKLEETISPMYIQIPVLASYRYNFSDAAQLQVNFGPYFAYGVGGKAKEKYSYAGETDETENDVFGDGGLLNRFDCGLQVGTGFTFAKHFNVSFTYEFGLTNAANKDWYDADVSIKNSNCMLNIGYNF